MSPTWENTTRRHGTQSGYLLHQQLDEDPCGACYQAKAEYDRRWRAAPDKARRSRLLAKAQGRAAVKMRALYPKVWQALYEEAKQELAEEGQTIYDD